MNVIPGPAHRKRFKIQHVGSAVATTLQIAYLIKDFLSPATLNIIYGEPGCGKSFLALFIVYLLSMGRKVFGRRVRPAKVLYVTLEGEQGFVRRVAAAADRWGASAHFFYIADSVDLFGGLGDIEALIDAIRELGAEVVVIDTLARAMGSGSENESADMGRLIEAFDVIRHETGAAVIAVHHAGKDSSRGMRGHSSLLAAADMAMEVKREESGRTFRIAKSKDGLDGEAFSFDLDVVELGRDSDGDLITSCAVREGEAVGKPAGVIALTPRERGFLKDLTALFAEPGLAEMITPASVSREVPGLTRNQVREGFKGKGLFTLNTDGSLTGADRSKMSEVLIALKHKGKIGMTENHVWLIKGRQ